MKIVHIILTTDFAGSERYVLDLINYQSKKNNCYLILNFNSTQNQLIKNLDPKIKLYRFNFFLKKIRINYLLKKLNPDIVHTHLGEASKIVIKKKFKLIATSHVNFKYNHFKNHDGIIVSNSEEEKLVKKKFLKKIKKIYLWTTVKRRESEKKNNLRSKLNIPDNSFIFGCLGRFHYVKGFDIAIKAFKKANLKNSYLIIAGKGHEKYLKFSKNKIKILEHQENLDCFFNTLNCFVLPSRWESFGLSLLEAMVFDLPIITTINVGNKEWINNFKVKTFESENFIDLSIKMRDQIHNEKKIKYNLKYFDYEENCKKIYKFYDEV